MKCLQPKEKKVYRIIALIIVVLAANAGAESVHSLIEQGNRLYADEQFDVAIERYAQAAEDVPRSPVPKFNTANSLYRLEKLDEAIENYKQAAAGSSEREVIAAAKYNLGNSFFQRALKNRQTEPEKTLEDIKTSIGFFRDALNIAPDNPNAAQNIEVAKTTYKQIKEQQQQQQENQESNSQDKDKQDQDQQQQQSQDGDQKDKDKQEQQGDQQQQEQQQDQRESEQGQPTEPMEKQMAPDATAQQILDKEKQQKKERRILQSFGFQKVEKDW